MLLTRGSREDAIHTLINLWLKDTKVYCGWCGQTFIPELYPCCEKPFIGTNADILKQWKFDNDMMRETRSNKFASNKSKTIQWKLSFPPGLLEFLTIAFKRQYNEDLFSKEYDTTWFARKFHKYFTIPEEV